MRIAAARAAACASVDEISMTGRVGWDGRERRRLELREVCEEKEDVVECCD